MSYRLARSTFTCAPNDPMCSVKACSGQFIATELQILYNSNEIESRAIKIQSTEADAIFQGTKFLMRLSLAPFQIYSSSRDVAILQPKIEV